MDSINQSIYPLHSRALTLLKPFAGEKVEREKQNKTNLTDN